MRSPNRHEFWKKMIIIVALSSIIFIHIFLQPGLYGMYSINEKTVCQQKTPEQSGRLPEGIVQRTSDLFLRKIVGDPMEDLTLGSPQYLLAIAVGIKQKNFVNKIVQRFPRENFTIMFFHYDGMVDAWKEYDWFDSIIHISVKSQGKWWFVKRFLHPDIVDVYDYIFLWDEDLGVDFFDPFKYLEIAKREGLEISQPALDSKSDVVHHLFTKRQPKLEFHKRVIKAYGKFHCDNSSIDPMCAGWVEVMAPVFTRDAWKCFWYLVQNDFVHGWGLDSRLGYCAKFPRSETVGVIDAAYVIHYSALSLGKGGHEKDEMDNENEKQENKVSKNVTLRDEVIARCIIERRLMRRRFNKALKDDKCYNNPYKTLKI